MPDEVLGNKVIMEIWIFVHLARGYAGFMALL